MSAITDKLTEKIATLQAEITQSEAQAAQRVTELEGQVAQLTTIRAALLGNPQLETFLAEAKALGLV